MSLVNIIGNLFGSTPNQPKAYAQYGLDELNSMTFFERAKLQDWRLELVTLGFTGVFVILFFIGDFYNKSLVTGFLNGINDTLKQNFYQVGVSKDELYIKDSSENYSSYATGRDNISRVNIDIKLRPRHNIFVWFLEGVISFFTEAVKKPIDKVDIVIYPSFAYDNFISAIVSKLGMNDYRKFNYFLSLTKTSDSAKIPESFVFMSEGNEFQEKILTEKLLSSLDIQAANFIRYFAFTDQSTERPESIEGFAPLRRVVVSLQIPSSKKDYEQVCKLLESIFDIIDKLASKEISFKPESLKKVLKTRENEIEKVQKAMELEKQEIEAEEKAKLKREERDRIRNLSPAEQAKLEKKEQERKQKKLQKKQRVRM
ncbi:UPF0674 endoplasmic reticulum membrane protein [[Candida] jaroonii]|uniref:UPF0674 endoplasmic reticulum membrane protein n=1 Tax=[Candida] jaroonii TaxID=467808 RepID=A0ACA9Y8J2_9ASCO|nr:UPF0674 endoplasmic reticulum membrane protein [[Candida] jaroonii]